jgi:hypothetical protein
MRFNSETARSIVDKALLPGFTAIIAFYLFQGNLQKLEKLVPPPYSEAIAHTIIEYVLSIVVGAAFFVGSLWNRLAAGVLIFGLGVLTLWEVFLKHTPPVTVFLTADGLLLMTIIVLRLILSRLRRQINDAEAENAALEDEDDPLDPSKLVVPPIDEYAKAGMVTLLYVMTSLPTSALSGLTIRTLLRFSVSASVAGACGTLAVLIAILVTALWL